MEEMTTNSGCVWNELFNYMLDKGIPAEDASMIAGTIEGVRFEADYNSNKNLGANINFKRKLEMICYGYQVELSGNGYRDIFDILYKYRKKDLLVL